MLLLLLLLYQLTTVLKGLQILPFNNEKERLLSRGGYSLAVRRRTTRDKQVVSGCGLVSFRKQKAPRRLRAVGPKVKEEDFLGEVTFQLRPTRHDVGTTGQCKCRRGEAGNIQGSQTKQGYSRDRGVERENKAAPSPRSDHGGQSRQGKEPRGHCVYTGKPGRALSKRNDAFQFVC